MEAVVVDTGVANTASVAAALERCGARAVLSRDAGVVDRANLVVLPGVGAFGAGMERLREGLGVVLRDRVDAGLPLLAICLGMQLLCERSEETPGVSGLGVVEGVLTEFPERVRRPQFGWNRVEAEPGGFVEGGYAYFANSYRLTEPPPGWRVATAEHGGRFVAAMQRGNVLACQFHPELSGLWGTGLLRRWLVTSAEGAPC